jgi:radical SAM/Cys-rich protein
MGLFQQPGPLMHDTLIHLKRGGFPRLRRRGLQTLQVNLGYLCNQSCQHCHVAAGPHRTEMMERDTAADVLRLLTASGARTLDLTGGAPEMNLNFRWLVAQARSAGCEVIDRCNLTVLELEGQEDLAEFLAAHQVQVVASLPCYLEENVDRQRGGGVFEASLRGLRRLNALGYGDRLSLSLVFNPQGPSLPPPQAALEADYRRMLGERYGIRFTRLLTLANMPIQRFGSMLISQGRFESYMTLLREAHRDENLEGVMCRDHLSVDWQGRVYDCDFNQMLGLPLRSPAHAAVTVRDLLGGDVTDWPIAVADHCFGCTAGQGSSCGGALGDAPETSRVASAAA